TVHLGSPEPFEVDIFPFFDAGLPLVEEEADVSVTDQTIVAEHIVSFENNDDAASVNGMDSINEFEVEHCQTEEEVVVDCVPALSLGPLDVEQVENLEADEDMHKAHRTLADELLSSGYDEDCSFNAGVWTSAVEDITFEAIASSGDDLNSDSFEEDHDAVLARLAGLFDDSSYILDIDATEDEESVMDFSAEASHTELIVKEDPDTV
ncbi:hypothetical protein C0993_002214, partial [Termitomyces sp. T159_Od127]